jgi:hypothetical protein
VLRRRETCCRRGRGHKEILDLHRSSQIQEGQLERQREGSRGGTGGFQPENRTVPANIMLGAMRIAFLLKVPGDADVMAVIICAIRQAWLVDWVFFQRRWKVLAKRLL